MNVALASRKPMGAAAYGGAFPSFYNPKNAGEWGYVPNLQTVFEESSAWEKRYGISAARKDQKNVHLLLIDDQYDFCYTQGSLYVGGRSGRGAIEDSARTVEFIYRNLGLITKITATLDTHLAYQIFSPSFWNNADGTSVAPGTVLSFQEVQSGKYVVSPKAAAALNIDYMTLRRQTIYYCEQLELVGKYKLMIWPFHCILGTPGHSLVGVIEEACKFHAFLRGAEFIPEVKGGNPLTENYSVLRPEVLTLYDGKPIAQKNVNFIKTLIEADRVIIAGQAASHCVKSTIDDLLDEILQKDPSLAKKVYIMRDCMSAVVIPGVVDFTDEAEASLKKFSDKGMHVVDSTTAIDAWPDF